MRIRLKKRSARWTRSFILRGGVLLGATIALMNAGYLAAEVGVRDPSDLWKTAVANNPLVAFAAYEHLRTSAVVPAFAIAIAAFIVIALGHFFTFGPHDMTIRGPQDAIPWWTLGERIVHGVVVVAFLTLLVSGLSITFGRYLGGGSGTLFLRQLHEMAGFVFTPFIVAMILLWVRHAIPRAYDWQWLIHAGGYLGYKGKLTSGKFNAGQKLWFWIMTVAALILIWTGIAEYFQIGPSVQVEFPRGGTIWTGISQYFQSGALSSVRMYVVLHVSAAIPIVLMFIVHFYLSTIGAKGLWTAMVDGKVSRRAVKKYHPAALELSRQGAATSPAAAGPRKRGRLLKRRRGK